MQENSGACLTVGSVVAGLGLIVGFMCVEIVTPGFRGVVTRMGTLQEVPMSEGLNFKLPWDMVEEWPIQVQKLTVSANAGSSDLQTVHTEISVNFRLAPELTPRIRRELGASYEENIIKPALQESVKAIIAKFQAAELLEKRAEVRHEVETILQSKLDNILAQGFILSALNIENFTFEESFNKAIESKQVAEQEAQRAHNEVAREHAEAEKKIEAARGRAESRKLEAAATAEATLVEAKARALAIEVESAVLRGNPDILKLRLIERWNGVMPQVMSGEAGNMLFNLPSSTAPTVVTTQPAQPENR